MLSKKLRIIKNSFKHPGAGKNLSYYRLIKQGIPYLLTRTGYSFNPLTVYLSVNSVCNFKCKMCDIGQGNTESTFYKNLNPGNNAQLTYDRVKVLIDEISKFNPLLAITTTEPLLYKPLAQVIEYATRSNMETLVTTNGFYVEKKAEELIDAGLKTLYMSLDGPPELHNEIRGIPKSFEKAIDGIRKVDEIRRIRNISYPRVRVGFTVSNFNFDRIHELATLLRREPIDFVTVSHLNYVSPESSRLHNEQFGHVGSSTMTSLAGGADPTVIDIAALNAEINRVKKDFPGFMHFSPDLNEEELKIYYRQPEQFVWDNKCLIPWYVSEIISNGDVIPMTRCFDVKFGNIYESSFSEIWNGSKMRTFRKQLQSHKIFPACTRCRGCL